MTELEDQASLPGFWNDPNAAKTIIDQTNQQRAVLKPFGEITAASEEVGLLLELAEAEEYGKKIMNVGQQLRDRMMDRDGDGKISEEERR